MSEDAEVLVPARTGLDVLVLTTALTLAVLTLGCCLYFLIFPDAAPIADGVRVPFLSKSSSEVVAVCALLAAVTVWLGARGFGALWRALDRRPILVANTDGLIFHPAFRAETAPWREVRRIRQAGWMAPYHLEIELRRRFWAVEAPLTTRRIRIGGLYLGNTGFVPPELISRLTDLAGRDEDGPPTP
ncbi:hypothetical protein PMI01_03127 [Caulobacter sp. AP07]|uniref:hypothetical protein n=1 Tax=Caulobacter sp. AP07 TaxID=1144304 RepID=UPI000271FC97|nr:hypothetical protein [Caulobacter sp. AP07]EJL30499.1 hypothetical protein PMI01_03127 [Caulobacter sp. AP07]